MKKAEPMRPPPASQTKPIAAKAPMKVTGQELAPGHPTLEMTDSQKSEPGLRAHHHRVQHRVERGEGIERNRSIGRGELEVGGFPEEEIEDLREQSEEQDEEGDRPEERRPKRELDVAAQTFPDVAQTLRSRRRRTPPSKVGSDHAHRDDRHEQQEPRRR
jgi:hypothetical protein